MKTVSAKSPLLAFINSFLDLQRYVVFLFLLFTVPAFGQTSVTIMRQDQKIVPVTVYGPKDASRGIAVISPGAGGSEKGFSYLGKALSGLGYLAVVVGHQESGMPALRQKTSGIDVRGGLSKLITDPVAYRGRFMDIAAALKWARTRCTTGQAFLIGHSLGAATTMIEAGAKNRLGVKGSDVFDAYIALSPQGVGSIFPVNAWQGITKPVLLLTGTRDAMVDGSSWKHRIEPFANLPAGCKWLGVIDGATHLNFAGRGRSSRTEELTIHTILAFLAGLQKRECPSPQPIQGIELHTK